MLFKTDDYRQRKAELRRDAKKICGKTSRFTTFERDLIGDTKRRVFTSNRNHQRRRAESQRFLGRTSTAPKLERREEYSTEKIRVLVRSLRLRACG
jgi:hypothetical protein